MGNNDFGGLFDDPAYDCSEECYAFTEIETANSGTGDDIKLSERLFVPQSKLRGFVNGKVGPKDGNDFILGVNNLFKDNNFFLKASYAATDVIHRNLGSATRIVRGIIHD